MLTQFEMRCWDERNVALSPVSCLGFDWPLAPNLPGNGGEQHRLIFMETERPRPKRVLVNALSARHGGGQTYVMNLLNSLPEDASLEIFVIAPESLNIPTKRKNIRRVHVRGPVKNPFTRALWERICLPKLVCELHADVLFCPGGIIGSKVPRDCRSVTTFQNMMPFDRVQRNKYPLGYMRIRNWLLAREMARSMAKADWVICISEFARRVIQQRVPGLPGKTIVIPHGINSIFRNDREPRPEWLPAGDYILYVSVLDVYKAQLEVVRAFALLKTLRPTSEKLILTGPERSRYADKVRDEIRRLDLQNDVFLTGLVSHETLPSLYHNALINIFASECENCPNIMLEALASGRPLLASCRPPMPEFGGDAAIYFDPSSPRELAEKIQSIIDDPVRLMELSDKLTQRSLLYDWSRAARSTWELIQNCA
jgi:glycosyltransferase involved in cell wall biosynthesis